jgi:Inorganic pyrophosphatase/exopolyphosphatase
VTGHKSPDSDTVGSSIAYAALLQALGYDSQPVVLGDINNETKYILETGGLEAPMLLEDASGCNMVLVDHSEYTQSAEGLQDANVITIIDHHGDGSVTTGNQLIYDARPLGSTATIIWIRYRNYGIEVDQKTAYAMVGSILSDTKNLQSATTTYADREALKELSLRAEINDTDAMYQEMFLASISYDGMTDEEIFSMTIKSMKATANSLGSDALMLMMKTARKI